jgi:hypothetical protein
MRDAPECETLPIARLALLGNAREIWIFDTCRILSTAENSVRATSECRQQEPLAGASRVSGACAKKYGEKRCGATADGRIHLESSESLKVIRERDDANRTTDDENHRAPNTDCARWKRARRRKARA